MGAIVYMPTRYTGNANFLAFVSRSLNTNEWWNTGGTPADEAYNAANIADYRIAPTEVGSTGEYHFTVDATTPSGWRIFTLYLIATSTTLAVADLSAGQLYRVVAYWNGTNIIPAEVMRGTDGANTTTPPTVGAIADAVLDEPSLDHLGVNTFGKLVADINTAAAAIKVVTDIMALSYKSSTVNDASASTTVFITALTEATDDHYANSAIVFTSGALLNQVRKISAYNGTTKTITLSAALTDAPANGVSFIIIGRLTGT